MVEKKGEGHAHLFSIVLIGDSSVGKSCLLKKFAEPDKVTPDQHTATVGVDFVVRTIMVNKEKVKLSVWDTAGQDCFNKLHNSYYFGAHVAIFVFDITRKLTYSHLKTWFSEMREHCPHIPAICIANKIDGIILICI